MTEHTCHPACKCREAKVEELVEAAEEYRDHLDPTASYKHDFMLSCSSCNRLQSAIEGVKG